MTQALIANGRAHTVAKSRARATTADHVVYRYDPRRTPCLTYHSIAGGLTGGANTLAKARESYRQLARIQRQGVPPAVEHLETTLAGMWVRAKVAAAHRDPSTDQMFLLTLLSDGSAQDALRASLARATTLGLNPVVVVVEPYETVSTVLDQTRTDDTLFVVHSDAENMLRWLTIHGPEVAGSRRAPLLMDRDRLRAMPIKDLTQAYSVGPQELRLQSSQLRDVRRQLVRLKGEPYV